MRSRVAIVAAVAAVLVDQAGAVSLRQRAKVPHMELHNVAHVPASYQGLFLQDYLQTRAHAHLKAADEDGYNADEMAAELGETPDIVEGQGDFLEEMQEPALAEGTVAPADAPAGGADKPVEPAAPALPAGAEKLAEKAVEGAAELTGSSAQAAAAEAVKAKAAEIVQAAEAAKPDGGAETVVPSGSSVPSASTPAASVPVSGASASVPVPSASSAGGEAAPPADDSAGGEGASLTEVAAAAPASDALEPAVADPVGVQSKLDAMANHLGQIEKALAAQRDALLTAKARAEEERVKATAAEAAAAATDALGNETPGEKAEELREERAEMKAEIDGDRAASSGRNRANGNGNGSMNGNGNGSMNGNGNADGSAAVGLAALKPGMIVPGLNVRSSSLDGDGAMEDPEKDPNELPPLRAYETLDLDENWSLDPRVLKQAYGSIGQADASLKKVRQKMTQGCNSPTCAGLYPDTSQKNDDE